MCASCGGTCGMHPSPRTRRLTIDINWSGFGRPAARVRDDFEKGKHPRAANGQFGAGTTVKQTKNDYGEEIHEVHHEGRKLGHVKEGMEYQKKANGKSTAAKSMVKRWAAHPDANRENLSKSGKSWLSSSFGHRSKKDAVQALKREHGIHD